MGLKSKVLIVGGTGYIGKRLVKASLEQGHETYVLKRPEIGFDIEKIQMLLSFKKQGARLVTGSFNDHRSLVEAVKQVDVVICAMSGVHFRSYYILLQLKLIDAIKEAGNIKVYIINAYTSKISFCLMAGYPKVEVCEIRTCDLHLGVQTIYKFLLDIYITSIWDIYQRFLPSEFGADPAKMEDALEPGRVTFDDKMVVRKAIEDARIPFSYVSANLFAGYFVGGLCQFGHLLPSEESVLLYGDGNKKCML